MKIQFASSILCRAAVLGLMALWPAACASRDETADGSDAPTDLGTPDSRGAVDQSPPVVAPAVFHPCAVPGMSRPLVAWSPDAKRFAVANSGGTVRVYGAADGKEVYAKNGLGREPSGPAFAPDGKLIAVNASGSVHLLSGADGTEVRSITTPGIVGDPFFSPDGTLVAAVSGSSPQVLLWHVADGSSAGSLTAPMVTGRSNLSMGAFTPDGKSVAVAGDGYVLLLRVADSALLHTFSNAAFGTTSGLAFTPDGATLVAAFLNNVLVRMWSLTDYQPIPMAFPQDQPAMAAALVMSPNGAWLALTAVGAGGPNVQMWQLRSGGVALPAPRLAWQVTVDQGSLASLAFAPDGSSLLIGDTTVWVRAVADGGLRLHIDERISADGVAALSADGQLLLTGGPASVDVWQTADGRHLSRHADGTGAAAFLNGAQSLALAVAAPPAIALRKLADGSESGRINLSALGTATATALAASPDGKALAAAVGTQVFLFPLADTAHSHLLATLPGAATTLVYSPDGALLAATVPDRKLVMLRVSDGQSLGTVNTNTPGTSAGAFSPDGAWLMLPGYPLRMVPAADVTQKGFTFRPTSVSGASIAVAWGANHSVVTMDDGATIQSLSTAGVLTSTGGTTTIVPAVTVAKWSPGWIGQGTLAMTPDGLRFAAVIAWDGLEDVRLFCRQP